MGDVQTLFPVARSLHWQQFRWYTVGVDFKQVGSQNVCNGTLLGAVLAAFGLLSHVGRQWWRPANTLPVFHDLVMEAYCAIIIVKDSQP